MYKIVKILSLANSKSPLYVVEKNGKQYFAKTVEKHQKHLFIHNDDNKSLILKECFYLEKLNDSGVTPSYVDSYDTEEDVTVVMEYLDVGWSDLFDFLDKPIEEETVRTIIRNVVLSIKKLSKLNIHYLDIKPENIMINVNDYDVRLVDFEDAMYSELRNPIVYYDIGTVGYKCPERSKGSFTVLESQVFSIGCLLLYCFDRTTNYRDEFTVSRINCTDLAKDLINKCLIQDPQQRIYIEDILWHAWFND